LFAIEIVAVRTPVADGLNVTSKVVDPEGAVTVEFGCWVTVKSAALVPPITTRGVPVKSRLAVPVLNIVNERTDGFPPTAAEPRSVSSAADGVVSPSMMLTLLPRTSISGPTAVQLRLEMLSPPASELLEKLRLADCEPVAFAGGEHDTETLIEPPAAMVVPIGGGDALNHPLASTSDVGPSVRVELPVFETVTVWFEGVPAVTFPNTRSVT
jgi:hypothetical protein